MRRVAKSVTLSLVESKRFSVINENFFGVVPNNLSTQWAVRNVFTPLNQGNSSYTIVGSEIVNPMLKVKITGKINWGGLASDTAANYDSVAMTVYLIACNEQYVAQTPTNFSTISPNPGWFYQPNGYNPTLNGNNVKVLKRWRRKVNPDQASGVIAGRTTVTGSMKYRWRRKLTFEDSATIPGTGGPDSVRMLRGWNYYLLVGTQVNTNYVSALTAPPLVILDTFLYYKDP